MAKQQILDAAILLFAKHGYEGTSMAFIAEEVGIKKQSIYTHYKNKDALFLEVCAHCVQDELRVMTEAMAQCATNYKMVVEKAMSRYSENESTQFWLRMMFYPPHHLHDTVMQMVETYIDDLEMAARQMFERAIVTKAISVDVIAKSFLAILDSVYIEMLYGNEMRATKRLEASYVIFERGIQ